MAPRLQKPRSSTAKPPSSVSSSVETDAMVAQQLVRMIFPPTMPDETLDKWFDNYADEDSPNEIGPEGIERFCEDINISLEGVEILYIAWRMNAKQMGFFTREEWHKGLTYLGVVNTAQLKILSDSLLDLLLNNQENFKSLYNWAFGFAKVDQMSRNIPVEMAIGLWKILLPSYEHTKKFSSFLMEKKPVKVINKDQWKSFLEFVTNINDDLNGYDELQAWPVLFDDYVAWRKSNGI